MNSSVYIHSILVQKLTNRYMHTNSLKIIFSDIDSSLSGEPSKQLRARKLLEENGYATVFVTSRPYELVMSSHEFEKSKGLTRPVAKWKVDQNGKHYYEALE